MVAQADSAVEATALGVGEIAGDTTNGFGGNSTELGNSFRREIDTCFAYLFDTFNEALDIAKSEEAFGEDDVAHGEKECCVGSGNDRKPLGCVVGGDCSTGINHDDLTAARFDAVDLSELIRACEKRTARGLRIAAHDHPVIGVSDVDRGDLPHVSVHQY